MSVDINELEDKILYCKDCGGKFIWTAGEQKFFIDNDLQNMPKRCKVCAAKHKAALREKHPMWWVKCLVCGRKSEVPFEDGTEDVYCEDCFKKEQDKRDQKLKELGKEI